MRKLGIYVQVPFCQTKCTYCNFHTGVVASSRFAPYVEAVCREIRVHREFLVAAGIAWGNGVAGQDHSQEWLCHELLVDTVYIGGGTPSLLDPVHLRNILDVIRETFAGNLQEVTLEADPATAEAGKAAAGAQPGSNRGGLGGPSF